MGNKSHFFRQSGGGVIGSPFLNFRFEETETTNVIENLNGFNAVLVGSTSIQNNLGYIGKGYLFDGTSYVETQPITQNYPFSYKVWFNSINGTSRSIIRAFDGNRNGVNITSVNRGITILFGNGESTSNSGLKQMSAKDFTYNNNEWYQIVLVVNGFLDIDLYLNNILYQGAYDLAGSATHAKLDNISYKIGGIPIYSDNSSTLIDEVTFFDKGLTQEEITEIYNKESNGIRVF